MLITLKKQKGMTLFEILVALSISMIIAVAVLGIFTSTIVGSQRILESGKLERDLNAIMDGIVADIQRTGYWASDTTTNAVSTNPFFATGTDITATNNCVTFAYDRDNNGTVTDGEKFGYRLGTSAIQFRPAGSTFACSPSPSNWVNLTDPTVIIITQFSTSLTNVPISTGSGGTDTTAYRSVTITLSGYLKTDSATVKTITRTVKLYNNKFSP